MRKSQLKFALSLLAIAVLLFGPVVDATTLTSSPATVNLTYAQGESITVTGVPAAVSFTSGTTPTSGNITITTTYTLLATRTSVNTNLFFTSATAALTDGAGDNIPVANVFANKDGGAYSSCATSPASGMPGTPGASCNVGQGATLSAGHYAGTINDTFTLQLQSLPATLAAGTYTGVLNIEAGAQ